MITVGLVLLILGFLLGIPFLWSLGVIVLVIGLIFLLLGCAVLSSVATPVQF